MASKEGGGTPPKNPELRGAGKKQSIQEILNEGSKSKKVDQTYEQHINKGSTTQRPKAEGKIEEKKKDADKPIVGKHTEKVIKDREHGKDE